MCEYLEANVKPKLGEFQLLGDSIFVRFANKVLHQSPNCLNGHPSLGYCVSGQRINQLRKKIKKNYYILTRTVMILIGTNDLLCGRDLFTMIRHYNKLMQLLRQKNVVKMVLLTLPPVPKLALTREHWETLNGFNRYILTLDSPEDKIRAIDIVPIFVKFAAPVLLNPPRCRKRKSFCTTDVDESPKKIMNKSLPSLPDPVQANLDDSGTPFSPFCAYLNRINLKESLKEAESSEDEGQMEHLRPFIDYYFWNIIQRQLPSDDEGPSTSQKKVGDFSPITKSRSEESCSSPSTAAVPLSSTMSMPISASGEPQKPKISNLCSKVMEYTSHFLRLDRYERFFYGGDRMDMIHPNFHGLKRLKRLFEQTEVL